MDKAVESMELMEFHLPLIPWKKEGLSSRRYLFQRLQKRICRSSSGPEHQSIGHGSKTRRGRVSDIAQTLDTGMQQHTLTSDIRIRRLTPIECERLQRIS